MSKALLIVDVQKDFLPGGALAVPDGDEVIEPILRIVKDFSYDYILLTGDFHPPETKHFKKWPPHCIEYTDGCELVLYDTIAHNGVVQKGKSTRDDGYSAFEGDIEDRWPEPGEGPQGPQLELDAWLSRRQVDKVDIVGLAFDYCVGWTALHSYERGYTTRVLMQGTQSINEESAINMAHRLPEAIELKW